MPDDQRKRMWERGWEDAANLPEVSPDCYRRIAEMLRDPINRFVQSERAREAAEAIRESCAS
jgi:hypothetical protein